MASTTFQLDVPGKFIQSTVPIATEGDQLDFLMGNFADFLRGCGFSGEHRFEQIVDAWDRINSPVVDLDETQYTASWSPEVPPEAEPAAVPKFKEGDKVKYKSDAAPWAGHSINPISPFGFVVENVEPDYDYTVGFPGWTDGWAAEGEDKRRDKWGFNEDQLEAYVEPIPAPVEADICEKRETYTVFQVDDIVRVARCITDEDTVMGEMGRVSMTTGPEGLVCVIFTEPATCTSWWCDPRSLQLIFRK